MDTLLDKVYRWLRESYQSKIFLISLIILIILLGAFLRFWNLRTNPEIYGDEGANMSNAWNLAHGKMQIFVFKYAFGVHPPLFFLILAGLLRIFGNDILVARALTVIYGILTMIILYFTGKVLYNKFAGLLSSLFFALCPLIILNNRWALTYNQLMFFSILTFLFSLKFIQTDKSKWIYFSGISTGCSLLTSLFGISDLIYLVIVSLIFGKKKNRLAPLITLFLFGIFVIIMLFVSPELFLHDLRHAFSRSGLSSTITIGGGILLIFNRFISFLNIGYWVPLSIVGFFLIEKKRERNLLLLIFILSSILILKIRSPSYTFYFISLMPYLMIGLAVFSIKSIIQIWKMIFVNILDSIKWLKQSSKSLFQKLGENLDKHSHKIGESAASVLISLIVIFFILVNFRSNFSGAISGFETPISELTVPLSADFTLIVEYINKKMNETDFVIASPHIGWQIQGNVSDILPPLVFKGEITPFFNKIFPRNRFVFDCSYDKAKFVIMDDFWRNWGSKNPVVKKMMDEIKEWPEVLRAGEFVVYQNATNMSVI